MLIWFNVVFIQMQHKQVEASFFKIIFDNRSFLWSNRHLFWTSMVSALGFKARMDLSCTQ